jgi:hypothetical protein
MAFRGGAFMHKTWAAAMAVVISFWAAPCFSQPLDVSSVASDIGTAVSSSSLGRFSSSSIFPKSSAVPRAQVPGILAGTGVLDSRLDRYEMSMRIADGVMSMADPQTHVAPSHFGHPGYQDAAFVYDKAVDALVFHAAGSDERARALLDYFAVKLRISLNEVRKNADANGIYGILKLVPSVDDPRGVGLVNAINCRSMEEAGQGQVEYWTTPGPVAFMVMAFLQVDRKKYLPEAIRLGEALLLMQRADGAITDGDRDARNVHTEPHMDTYSAFLMLYDVTGDKKWSISAERAWTWFEKNVYRPGEDVIHQGMRPGGVSEVFATDAYSWTIAGRGGDRIPLDVLERLTDTMLRRSLAQVTLELPDGRTKTVTLVDFADVQDMRITADRGGFHPMGSVEWIGGVILALQKNAVRFWDAGDALSQDKARFYKSLAEFFTQQSLDSFYEVEGIKGLVSFYATGQWIATGHGWKTPYFYVKDPLGKAVIRGGSTISSWPVLPIRRINPFKLDDAYGRTYDVIPIDDSARQKAKDHVAMIARQRMFMESVPTEMAADVGDMPEMWRYNVQMFNAFNRGDYYAAILWAQKVVGNSEWRKLAIDQQARKKRDIGGIVEYPWGRQPAEAKLEQRTIQKYPLLNEMGAAMWGMAVSQYKLGNKADTKAWIRTVIETVPYHQIFAPAGPGYWNALVSWQENPGGTLLDAEMGELYREVLKEMKLPANAPQSYSLK